MEEELSAKDVGAVLLVAGNVLLILNDIHFQTHTMFTGFDVVIEMGLTALWSLCLTAGFILLISKRRSYG